MLDDNDLEEWARYNYGMPQPPAASVGSTGTPITWGAMNPPQNVDGGWSDEHTGGFVPANGGNPAGYMDLSYWASRGVPADQIFDFTTGQTKPGWQRTANGYERTGGGGTTTPGGDPIPTSDVWPRTDFNLTAEPTAANWNWPTFTAPKAPEISPFVFNQFKAPTMAEAEAEPGYQFARDQGRKMLETNAAARGVLRSGGTLKDFIEFGNKFGEQNYGNVFNRAKDIFNLNEGNRFNAFNANTANTFNTFDRNYKGAWDEFTPQFDASKLEFQDAYNRWRDQLNALTELSKPVY